MKYCTQCGFGNSDLDSVCAACGAALADNGTTPGYTAPQQPEYQQPEYQQPQYQQPQYQQPQYQQPQYQQPEYQQPQYQQPQYQQPQYQQPGYQQYQQPYGAPSPKVATKAEFLKLPENAKIKKELLIDAIICYICAGLTLILGVFILGNVFSLIDVAILAGMGVGIHLKQSRVCAIILMVYAAINAIYGILTGGGTGWLIIIAGVFSVIYTFKFEKMWKEYQQQP